MCVVFLSSSAWTRSTRLTCVSCSIPPALQSARRSPLSLVPHAAERPVGPGDGARQRSAPAGRLRVNGLEPAGPPVLDDGQGVGNARGDGTFHAREAVERA